MSARVNPVHLKAHNHSWTPYPRLRTTPPSLAGLPHRSPSRPPPVPCAWSLCPLNTRFSLAPSLPLSAVPCLQVPTWLASFSTEVDDLSRPRPEPFAVASEHPVPPPVSQCLGSWERNPREGSGTFPLLLHPHSFICLLLRPRVFCLVPH